MGVRAAYIMSRTDPDIIIENLGLKRSGTAKKVPNSNWAGQLKNGWKILQISDEDFPLREAERVAAISKKDDVVITHISETVGYGDTVFLSKGSQKWRIISGDERHHDFLIVEGKEYLPQTLRDYVEAIQTDEEKLDAAAVAMGTITGFRYDDSLKPSELDQIRLIEVPTPRLREHGLSAAFWNWFNRHPLMGLCIGFLGVLLIATPLTMLAGGLLGGFLEMLLGDFGDTCLFNCESTNP